MVTNIAIRLCIWILGFLAFFGNVAVIICWVVLTRRDSRIRGEKANIQSFLLSNLAGADMLMGIYLLTVAVHDALWQGEYFKHDVEWRSGLKCQIAGAMSSLSSEVSVMMLVMITADRVNSILLDFSARRLNKKTARMICVLIWVIGLGMSFTPLFAPSYFNDQLSGFSFYGRSTVCLPLQLSTDRPPGWEYSVGVYIVFNGMAFVFILISYIAIFIKVRQSSKKVSSSSRKESALAKRVFFVVMTDFCCWMPVILLGVLSLTGHFNDPSGHSYVWIAVFVLPVNSSINPILYTFSSPYVRTKIWSNVLQWRNQKATPDKHPIAGRSYARKQQTKLEELGSKLTSSTKV